MDKSKFKNGIVHFRNSGMKGSALVSSIALIWHQIQLPVYLRMTLNDPFVGGEDVGRSALGEGETYSSHA